MNHFFRWKTLLILAGMFALAASSGCAMFDEYQDDDHEAFYHRK